MKTVIMERVDACMLPFYKIAGRRPWTPGYYSVKKRNICDALDRKILDSNNELPLNYGFGIDERVVEYPWVYSKLPAGPARVLDAGSSLNHGYLLDRLDLKRIQLTIMTLAPEKRCYWRRLISYVYGDLRRPFFAEASFDVVVSISTIEHIGLNNTLLYTSDSSKNENDALGFVPAVREFRRVLKPGGVCLITVPFGRRNVCDWYQVFDAALVQKVVEAFKPSEVTIDYFGYSAAGWQRTTSGQLTEAVFHDAKKCRGAAPDRAAAARGVACLRLMA